MPNVSADIDTFLRSENNANALTNLGGLPLAGGTLSGNLIVSVGDDTSTLTETSLSFEDNIAGTSVIIIPGASDASVSLTLPTLTGTLLTDASTLLAANLSGTILNAQVPAVLSGKTSITSTLFIGALTGIASGNLPLTGGTLTGALSFSGTTHAGIRFNNLTTTQRDALASPLAGMALWNTTTSRLSIHDGTSWTAGFVRIAGDAMTGALTNSTSGALSAPAFALTGTPITGGTATTTKPLALIEPSGSTSNNWSTSGTMLGVTTASGFVGDALRLQGSTSASTNFRVMLDQSTSAIFFGPTGSGLALFGGNIYPESTNNLGLGRAGVSAWNNLHLTSSAVIGFNNDTFINRAAAASIQLGANNATTATNQTIKAHNVTTGTGADLILAGGTGSVANGNVRFGTHAAVGVELVTGYITIKDESGTPRKIAVIS